MEAEAASTGLQGGAGADRRGRHSRFELLPAIDLRGGRVVRLREGDFGREDVFADDPAAVARSFADRGAGWIHVVDLDGAREGARRQADSIGALVGAIRSIGRLDGPRVQVAGGLRSFEAIAAVLGLGVDRIVVGTAALRDPSLVRAAVDAHGPERVAVALDVRDGFAVGDGWVPGATRLAIDLAIPPLLDAGVTTFIVTAIERDGLLGGPNLAGLAHVRDSVGRAAVIASGGITTIEDLRAVRALGCAGAIVGRAIYDGTLSLEAAVRFAAEENGSS